MGGADKTGSHLYSIHPQGSSDSLPFTTMGSGSLAAMAVFEANWKADMTVTDELYKFCSSPLSLYNRIFL